MRSLDLMVQGVSSVLVAGHRLPDGDCTGACIALYHYLKRRYPDKEVTIFLESMPEAYAFLDEAGTIVTTSVPEDTYDLAIAVDCSAPDCLGGVRDAFDRAKKTVCIDHHISNQGYADENILEPAASSSCEVVYGLMEPESVDKEIAAALYIGIMFDTGVFRYSNTSGKTLEIAGKLIDTGIPFWEYIDKCYNERTYTQTQLLGRTLLASMRLMDGQCIVAAITRRMMSFYGAGPEDIEGIVEQMRITKGVEVAILLIELGDQEYRVSMRSNKYVDVSRAAVYYNGGGHKKAAGCTMHGSIHDVINNLTKQLALQM